MPLTIPSQADIAEDYLREVSNQLPDADVYADSDYRVRANAIASAQWGLYQYAAWALRQAFPDTADTGYLEMHARLRGLTRKQVTAAGGNVTLTGKAATPVAGGLQFRVKGNATLYQTTEGGKTADDGTLTVAAKATTTGTAGNLTAGATGTLVSAPSGIDSAVTVVSMTGATDTETDEALLARLLDVMRQPAAGGNAHDYKVWAESVPGVSGAYVFPLRRGPGTVDVVLTATGGLPSAETLKATQDYIDSVRPVTAKDCRELAPTVRTVDVTAAVGISDSTTSDAVKAAITASLSAWFSALIPGQEAIRSLLAHLGGVPARRKINGHALCGDLTLTTQDIFAQAQAIGDGADLNSLTAPGLYYQQYNVQARTGRHYSAPLAGTLTVLKHAGITQVYRVYHGSRCFVRSCYEGTWTDWAQGYDTLNPPSAGDTGAYTKEACDVRFLALTGGTVSGAVRFEKGLQVDTDITGGPWGNGGLWEAVARAVRQSATHHTGTSGDGAGHLNPWWWHQDHRTGRITQGDREPDRRPDPGGLPYRIQPPVPGGAADADRKCAGE